MKGGTFSCRSIWRRKSEPVGDSLGFHQGLFRASYCKSRGSKAPVTATGRWVTVNSGPATVRVPDREAPVALDETWTFTWPSPEPESLEVTVIQSAFETALHGHPVGLCTTTVTFKPEPGAVTVAGDIEYDDWPTKSSPHLLAVLAAPSSENYGPRGNRFRRDELEAWMENLKAFKRTVLPKRRAGGFTPVKV